MSNASEELRIEYLTRFPLQHELTENVATLLDTFFAHDNKRSFRVEKRTKDVDHFLEKANRIGKTYTDPLNQIKDTSGIRVIVPTLEDLEYVGNILWREFDVDPEHTLEKDQTLEPDRFGYLSHHYVLCLSEPRASSREWRKLKSLWAEVQVRTFLQDAWAQVTHSLMYKAESAIPDALKRRVYAVSALLEVADRELDAVFRIKSERINERVRQIEETGGAIPLDSESLLAYLQSSKTVQHWVDTATLHGIQVTQSVDQLQMAHRVAAGSSPPSYEHSIDSETELDMARRVGITSVEALDAVLVKSKQWGEEYLVAVIRNIRRYAAPGNEQLQPLTVIRLSRTALVSYVLRANYPLVFTNEAPSNGQGVFAPWIIPAAIKVVDRSSAKNPQVEE